MADEPDKLGRYRDKRHFGATDEPRGADAPSGDDPSFVIQIHDASTMHFDFRLEVDGVLKSWSVPKGPPAEPSEKRLAVPTEDHPLEYREYEGVIAGGQYGAGAVIVWDQGTYRPLGDGGDPDSFRRALEHGHASFRLYGTKLRGAFALTRFRDGTGPEKEAWLLVRKKTGTDGAPHGSAAPDPRRARSARTGRTLHQVAEETARERDEE
ncbi:3'-phosphoesterase [Streptomyces sp. AcH 505]|uniref:DNA polymerase ligase N-terminal domain-containing protein n=1 Tax=unclassified Streptomyces TaxID=2593676 RepID=UPI000591D965|nr:DNA polymerase ligase N-terminal domain-containing protein [Streptomyces sp. NBC_00370]KIF71821.1 3'-phosphoesterase [Streptomyces sp. AcH 505]